MPLHVGILSPVVPVTREAFGPDGKGTIVAQVDGAGNGFSSLGLLFTDGDRLWTHPGLLTPENRPRRLTWYRLTLEDGQVTMRQDMTRASGYQDARVFRVPPLAVTSTPVDTLVRLIDALRGMHGRCACGDGCLHGNDRPGALGLRDAVLVELERHSGTLLAVCGPCYDALAAEDTHLRDEQTIIDGRRILAHAALQIVTLPG